MALRKSRRRAFAGQADAEVALAAMRTALSQALHKLVDETRENPAPTFVARAVAHLVDAWTQAALSMITAASMASTAPAAAPATEPARQIEPETVGAALLVSLRLIVDGVRAGRPDHEIDVDCQRLADTFSTCLRDAIAGAYLRTATAFEEQLGIPPGIAN
ncbi:MAG: hypothetical protein JF567_09620 [Xanthomonadales bacterium]|nr:hypothetical protein [Xanthomonadales bacterium]